MGADVRFRVDWIRCDGYGLCGDLVPDLIDVDEWRYPIVLPGSIDPSRLHDAQRAVDCCPMKALAMEAAGADRRPVFAVDRAGPDRSGAERPNADRATVGTPAPAPRTR